MKWAESPLKCIGILVAHYQSILLMGGVWTILPFYTTNGNFFWLSYPCTTNGKKDNSKSSVRVKEMS